MPLQLVCLFLPFAPAAIAQPTTFPTMSATTVTNNPPPQTESKSAKKKRAKADAISNGDAAVSVPSNPETPASAEPTTNGVSSEAENTFLRDLQK